MYDFATAPENLIFFFISAPHQFEQVIHLIKLCCNKQRGDPRVKLSENAVWHNPFSAIGIFCLYSPSLDSVKKI
jgi:hypothetical protein